MSVDTWMHFDPRDDLLEASLECESEVFLRWYGNSRAQLEDEYGPYADATRFITLTDELGDVVAVMRLIGPGGTAGLKTLTDLGREPWGVSGTRSASAAGLDLRSTWDVATIGTRRKSGGAGVRFSLALYHGLVMVGRANGISGLVAIVDERVRRLLDSTGLVMHTLPGTRTAPYLGSESSTPIYSLATSLLDNQRRNAPEAFALLTGGQGLGGVSVPPLEEFRVGARDGFADLEIPATMARMY